MKKTTALLLAAAFVLMLTGCAAKPVYGLPESVNTKYTYKIYSVFPGPAGFEYAPQAFDADWVGENFSYAGEGENGKMYALNDSDEVFMVMGERGIVIYDMRNGGSLRANYTTTGIMESADYYVNWSELEEDEGTRDIEEYTYTFTAGSLTQAVARTTTVSGPYDSRTTESVTEVVYDGSGAFHSGKFTVYPDGGNESSLTYTLSMLGLKESVSYTITGQDDDGAYYAMGYYDTQDGSYLGCICYHSEKDAYTYYSRTGKEITADDLGKAVYGG